MGNFPENWETDVNSTPIPPEYYIVDTPKLNVLYHLSWAKNNGMVWRLLEILNTTHCVMETPRTHKKLVAKITDLRETNKSAKYKYYHKP